MYTINNLPSNLVLGRQGEKNVTSFEFDVSSWLAEYPTGVISINVRRPDETEAQVYSAIGVTTNGNIATWLVDDVDTAKEGRGTISITLSTPGIANVKKSRAITTVVLEGNIFSANPPSGISQWLIEATNMLSNLEDAYDAITDGPESSGLGSPAQNALYLGQIYVDRIGLNGYLAVQLGTGASDWKQIT